MSVDSVETAFSAQTVPKAPEDPLFGLMAAYKADTDPHKVDLGIGAYRDDNAKPWVLPVVKKVDYCSALSVPITFTDLFVTGRRDPPS